MSARSLSTMDFPKESNPFHYLKYIDFLQREGTEDDYIEGVSTLMATIANSVFIDFENKNLLAKTIQHCLTVSAKLFTQNQQSQALDILEAARNLLSKNKSKDPVLEKFRTMVYNNISAYCLSVDDSSMGIKFLQNCIKKDVNATTNLTCIFYNNLAGVYLAHSSYEKAFQLTKKSIYLIEPEIFAEVQQKPLKTLREDEGFKKNLIILLVGYLNMGSILEGYQFQTTIAEPSKEMYDMNPKDFYKNAYGLAKKFLGENHSLTSRLYYCYSKSDLVLFKGIPTEASEADRNTSPKQRLRNMLDSIDDEDNKYQKKGRARIGHFSQSYSAKSVHKNFMIRKNSLSKPAKHQTIDSSETSNDGYDTPEERTGGHHFHSSEFNRYQSQHYPPLEGYYPKFSAGRPKSGTYRQHDAYSQGLYNNSPSPSPDQTQIFMQMMFQQQLRHLEDNFNRKIDELKNITKQHHNSVDTDARTLDSKDDPKIKVLEKELELLKEKMNNMKIAKELKQKTKAQEPAEEISPIVVNRHPVTSRDSQLRSYPIEVKPSPPIIQNMGLYSENKGKESEQSTKSSGPEPNNFFLSPNKMLLTTPVPVKPKETEMIDQHNNTGLPGLDVSPTSTNDLEQPKNEKPFDVKIIAPKPSWVPGKYSDPQTRKFKLDLKKVENYKGPDEEVRNRDDDEKLGGAPPKLKVIGKDKGPQETTAAPPKLASMNPSVPKLVKQTEKVQIKPPSVEKTQSAPPGSTNNAAPKEEETVKRPVVQEKPEKIEIQEKQEKQEKANTTITPKGIELNDDSKSIGEEEKLGRSDTTDRSKSLNHGYKRNSLSIPTSLDYMDSPTGSHLSSTVMKLPKYAIIRKRVFMRDGSQFMLICTASWTKEEKNFKLQLMGPEEKNQTEFTKVESELELPYKDLRKILKLLEYKDVMPVTFHIKQIKNFYTLVRYLLMPFTTIRALEDGKKEIAIYPKPPSLLTNSVDELPTIEFMGLQCVIIFTHVTRNTFRIILTDPEIVEDALRIDVDFDKTSFEHCFERHGGVDAPLRTVETSVKIIQGYDEDADADEMTEFRDVNKKLNNPARQDEEELESFKVIHSDLVEDLGNTLKEMETYLLSLGIKKLNQLADKREVKYCKLKFCNKMQKAALHMIWDRPEKQILEVKLKNFFETFAPGNKKIKACGETKFLYDSVWKHFGLNYNQLEYLDKIAVCNLVSDVYDLVFFDKELNKEDLERYQENPISFVPIEVGAYHRTFLGEKYKFPLTLSLVGIKGEPKGIKAVIYNMDEVLEVGAFFHISPMSWIIQEADKKKKKRSEKVNPLPLIENYYLDRILKKCGWDILKNWLVLEKRPNRVDIIGIKIFKDIRITEQIENVLNSDTILKYINDKDQVES